MLKNYKMLVKQINLNKWRARSCSWAATLNTVKTSIILKFTYRFNTVPIKISVRLPGNLGEITLKFFWKFIL